jgi:hypothetical protein
LRQILPWYDRCRLPFLSINGFCFPDNIVTVFGGFPSGQTRCDPNNEGLYQFDQRNRYYRKNDRPALGPSRDQCRFINQRPLEAIPFVTPVFPFCFYFFYQNHRVAQAPFQQHQDCPYPYPTVPRCHLGRTMKSVVLSAACWKANLGLVPACVMMAR